MDSANQAPAGAYEPDESRMEARFARPARQVTPERETFVAGHSFNGVDREEADRLRWENAYRRPVKVEEER